MKHEKLEDGTVLLTAVHYELSDDNVVNEMEKILGSKIKNFNVRYTDEEYNGDEINIECKPFPPIDESIEKLNVYLDLDYSSQSELCERLIDLYEMNSDYYQSEAFKEELEYELQRQLTVYEDLSVIVEVEEVIPEKKIKSKSMEKL